MDLAPCASCDRHRRVTETSCPFCGASAIVAEPARARGLVSRAAIAFGGVALGIAGCVSKGDVYGAPPPPPRPDAGLSSESAPVPAYGAPLPPAATDAATDAGR